MRKAGIMLKKVDNSQLGYYATKSANWIAEKMTNVDIVMFVKEHAVHPVMPLFATMAETDIWGYDAPVIATDLASAKTLLSASGPTEKFFYVWDLEWLRLPDYNHEELSKIYNIYIKVPENKAYHTPSVAYSPPYISFLVKLKHRRSSCLFEK